MQLRKINTKKGFEFKSAFFAIVVASMIIIAVGSIFGNWESQYDSGINYDLDEFDQLEGIRDEAQFQKSQVTPQDANAGIADFEGRLFRGGYGILGRIFTPFRLVFNMIESIENRFSLPSYIAEGVTTMLFFAIITGIIAVLFRLNRTNA